MFNLYFKNIVGTLADQYFQTVGIHATLIRYDGKLIKPNPIVGDRGIQPLSDGTEFQGYQTENVKQYSTSIPEDSLSASLGPDWKSAIAPNATGWQVSEDNGTTWRDLRISGTPIRARTSGRYGITLVGKGVGE